MAGAGEKPSRRRRDYRPTIEGLEALRLLSAAQAHLVPGLAVERNLPAGSGVGPLNGGSEASLSPVSSDAWDAALGQSELADLLASPGIGPVVAAAADPALVNSGLTQLNRYLARTWSRAGLSAQVQEDSTQAVYAALLQQVGRHRFDALVSDVGRWGIREVFTRETSDGIAFFRAVDMVKKRAQREKVYQSIDSIDVPSPSGQGSAAMRAALREAIASTLSPREAALIEDTLQGMTPAEIAHRLGVAPKTISNEKSRVLQKLREALVDQELN